MKKVWGWIAVSNVMWALISLTGIKLTALGFLVSALLCVFWMVTEKE